MESTKQHMIPMIHEISFKISTMMFNSNCFNTISNFTFMT